MAFILDISFLFKMLLIWIRNCTEFFLPRRIQLIGTGQFASLTIGMMEQWNTGIWGLFCIALKKNMIYEINPSWVEKISILKLIESLQKKQKDQNWEDNFQTK